MLISERLNGAVPGDVGPPIANPFIVTIPPNLLWVTPPLRPQGLQNLRIDLFELLIQLEDLP